MSRRRRRRRRRRMMMMMMTHHDLDLWIFGFEATLCHSLLAFPTLTFLGWSAQAGVVVGRVGSTYVSCRLMEIA